MTTTQENQLELENVYTITDKHVYTVVNTSIYEEWEDCCEVGNLTLLNRISGEQEEFTIWGGNSEGNYFYVCLPTNEFDEDDEEILDVTSLDFFGIDLSAFKELSNKSRIAATYDFLSGLEEYFHMPVSFREAYRALRNANQLYLYNAEGKLITNDGNY
ncbi:hypothetical protein [Psychrobacillus sp. FSL H8-0510]|uniref:hypothetical protein n=1 Tax=Psychrobacillus sp. FSL H8-0510 TaxID=2921394 RepID=UPI0030F58D21